MEKFEKFNDFYEYNPKRVRLKNGNRFIKSSLISRNRIVNLFVMQVKLQEDF